MVVMVRMYRFLLGEKAVYGGAAGLSVTVGGVASVVFGSTVTSEEGCGLFEESSDFSNEVSDMVGTFS